MNGLDPGSRPIAIDKKNRLIAGSEHTKQLNGLIQQHDSPKPSFNSHLILLYR